MSWNKLESLGISRTLGIHFTMGNILENLRYKSNGTDHFGSVQPEYLGPPLKVVHLDQSYQSGQNVPFHLKTFVPLFCILFTYFTKYNNQMHTGLGQVCATRMYRFVGQVGIKFQSGIFVEWKIA